jgi:hypothetical protein
LLVVVAACSQPATKPSAATNAWSIPAGWKHELIPFPLEFAPDLHHRGVEELRFPPGFLDGASPNRWSYAFAWRLDDAAELDAPSLGAELEAYFRGLLIAVDGDKHRFAADQITATATPAPSGFTLSAHIIDAFGDASAVELVGSARRTPCGQGALWTFVLAPQASALRGQLDDLARAAACGQPPAP